MQKLFESWRRFSEVKNYTPDPEEFPHDRARSKDEYIKEFPTIDVRTKEHVKDVVRRLLSLRKIGIERDNITFNP